MTDNAIIFSHNNIYKYYMKLFATTLISLQHCNYITLYHINQSLGVIEAVRLHASHIFIPLLIQ